MSKEQIMNEFLKYYEQLKLNDADYIQQLKVSKIYNKERPNDNEISLLRLHNINVKLLEYVCDLANDNNELVKNESTRGVIEMCCKAISSMKEDLEEKGICYSRDTDVYHLTKENPVVGLKTLKLDLLCIKMLALLGQL